MHRILELLSIGRTPGRSPLARLDARVKLMVAVAAILAAVGSTRFALPLATLGVSLGLLAAFRAPWGATIYRLTAPLAVVAMVCLLRALMTGKTPLVSLPLGPWRLVVYREGLAGGGLIAARSLGSISVIVVLCTFTQAHEIFAALRWARVPRTWIEIAMLMLRSIFTLFEQAASVLSAQKARLGYAGYRRALVSLGSLAGIVMLRSIDQAGRTHEAMVARGYQGRLPVPALPPLTRTQRAVAAIAVGLIIAAFLLAERWPP
jgi:cobalt/nickel transport system permease protein